MSILKKLFSTGAKDLVESVGEVIDELHTSQEEKDKAYAEVERMIKDYDHKMQQEVSRRWEADMQGNWLSKSIRPLSLAFLLVVLTVFTLVDFGFADLEIKENWTDLWQILAITAFGAYFGGRSIEKFKK